MPRSTRAADVDALRDALADFPAARSDDALMHLLQTLCGWLGADNAFWVGAVRMAGGAAAMRDPQHGWRGRAALFLRSNARIAEQTRAAIRSQDQPDPDMATCALTAGAGTFRVHRMHDGFIDFDAFRRTAPYETLYGAPGISDRLWAVCPVNADAESYLVFSHVRSKRRFSRADAALAAHVLSGMKWFQRQILLSHGLPLASEPLAPAERRVLLQLIGGQSEKRIAAALSLTPGTAHQYAVEVYRKLGVPGRSVLSALWLRG